MLGRLGYRLLDLRRGTDGLARLARYAESERWSRDRMEAHQLAALDAVLASARRGSPFWRHVLDAAGIRGKGGDPASRLDEHAALPVLDAARLRRAGAATPDAALSRLAEPASWGGHTILHLGDAGSIQVQRWVTALAERGWRVHLASWGTPPRDFPPATLAGRLTLHRFASHQVPVATFAWRLARLARLVRRLRPHLVHAHSIPAYGVYAALAAPARMPLVVTAWGYSHLARRGAGRRLDARCVARADAVTSLVAEMRDRIVADYGLPAGKVHYIQWGVDLDLFRPGYDGDAARLRSRYGIPAEAKVLLSNRNMDPFNGIDTILRAFAGVAPRHPDAVLLLRRGYGKAGYEEQMQRLARELGVEARCVFDPEFRPYSDMPALLNLARASIMVPPTAQGSASLTEAMACGALPIATALPGNADWVEDGANALLVPPGDVEALARAMERALSDDVLVARARDRNAAIMRERGDWRVNVPRLEDLYRRLLAAPRSRRAV